MTRLVDLLGPQAAVLRCIGCGGLVEVAEVTDAATYPELGPDGVLACAGCSRRFPLIGGTPRMLDPEHWSMLRAAYPEVSALIDSGGDGGAPSGEAAIKQRTARSFAYEWEQFGVMRDEWSRNFADYLQPHRPADLAGRTVLDVGAGSGRHSLHAAHNGARVVAVDLGASIDVARRNLPTDVLTVQADAERLPFEPSAFDFVMSIGVLHHLPEPSRALRRVARHVRPGGHLHVYLYWVPERPAHRTVLRGVTAARRLTVRLPHPVLHALCWPLAGVLQAAIVSPYTALRRRPRGRRIASALPLKTYADYPFSVLVNDQFDRFSAPLERRYTAGEVRRELEAAGLSDVTVLPNHGWVAGGVMPVLTSPRGAETPQA